MLIKTILLCALLTLIVACSAIIAYADSGWPECNLGTASYNQPDCIDKAEQWKGTQAPYDIASNANEAIALYHWATSAPRPLSGCTALGVAGEEWPGDRSAVCADFATSTPTATWTITPTPTQTVTPTATPVSTKPPVIAFGSPWWLPIVGSCMFADHDYQACGR